MKYIWLHEDITTQYELMNDVMYITNIHKMPYTHNIKHTVFSRNRRSLESWTPVVLQHATLVLAQEVVDLPDLRVGRVEERVDLEALPVDVDVIAVKRLGRLHARVGACVIA